jgi:SAM-dependent methyltransferase
MSPSLSSDGRSDAKGAPNTNEDAAHLCPVCQLDTFVIGSKQSAWSGRTFTLRRCPSCDFTFVANPRTDYEAIYDEAYYSGRGADPLVNYIEEIEHRDSTIRRYEWRGIYRVVSSLVPTGASTRWLDYGCGMGGLVEFVQAQGVGQASGFDQGWCLSHLAERGIPHLSADEVGSPSQLFDIVTAIEMIEHTPDPVGELTKIRSLLRPGGLLFLTTGNAAPYRKKIPAWGYVVPDVHISFFEPNTLAVALDKAGFDCEFIGYRPGWEDIIRFKVLKSLGVTRDNWITRIVPWRIASRVVDLRLKPSAHPIAWARVQSD